MPRDAIEISDWTPGSDWRRIDTGGGVSPWVRDLGDRFTAYLTDNDGISLDSPNEPCEFSIWRDDDEIIQGYGEDASQALEMISAWARDNISSTTSR